jgi:uncharacterized protein
MMVAGQSIIKIVFDTNVVISATLFRSGVLSPLRAAWQTGKIVSIISKETSAELLRVLAYKKFKLAEADIARVLGLYLPHAQTHEIDHNSHKMRFVPICRDKRDQVFLELAQSSQADLLVTGDEDLLCLDDANMTNLNFRIITPVALIARL